jgi:hypothetical protein
MFSELRIELPHCVFREYLDVISVVLTDHSETFKLIECMFAILFIRWNELFESASEKSKEI